jgi:hypothetical protein
MIKMCWSVGFEVLTVVSVSGDGFAGRYQFNVLKLAVTICTTRFDIQKL